MTTPRKPPSPRCRSIGGVVYDLAPTDRKPPCARGRPPKPAAPKPPKPAPAPKPKPASSVAPRARAPLPLTSAEQALVDHVLELNRVGLLYAQHRDTSAARRTAGLLPGLVSRGALELVQGNRTRGQGYAVPGHVPPDKREIGDFERRKRAQSNQVRVNDHAVLERLERERTAAVTSPPRKTVSDYDRSRQRKRPLPSPIDPSTAKVGDRVSVFNYADNRPDPAVIEALPGLQNSYGSVSVEPAVLFVPGSPNEGMHRYIRWERMFPGWLDPNVNWRPWKG